MSGLADSAEKWDNEATEKASPRGANRRAHGTEGVTSMQAQNTATVREADTDIVASLILKAVHLQRGEAFNIGGPDGIIVARSTSGKLWVGNGGIPSNWVRWWRKGDPHENLAEACRASLDWTKTGYFARDFRGACEWALDRPALRVTGIGRQTVRLAA